jgi:hypothetical protein
MNEESRPDRRPPNNSTAADDNDVPGDRQLTIEDALAAALEETQPWAEWFASLDREVRTLTGALR